MTIVERENSRELPLSLSGKARGLISGNKCCRLPRARASFLKPGHRRARLNPLRQLGFLDLALNAEKAVAGNDG